jgi:hypothetical protein
MQGLTRDENHYLQEGILNPKFVPKFSLECISIVLNSRFPPAAQLCPPDFFPMKDSLPAAEDAAGIFQRM